MYVSINLVMTRHEMSVFSYVAQKIAIEVQMCKISVLKSAGAVFPFLAGLHGMGTVLLVLSNCSIWAAESYLSAIIAICSIKSFT